MIWVLLGFLLFGFGVAGADGRADPRARVAIVQDHIESIVADPERMSAARAISDRLVREAAGVPGWRDDIDSRLRALDDATELDADAYFALAEAIADEMDAREQSLLDLRMDLSRVLTAAEWQELYAKLGATSK